VTAVHQQVPFCSTTCDHLEKIYLNV